MRISEEYYDSCDLDNNSQYASLSKKHLVIEAEYMRNALLLNGTLKSKIILCGKGNRGEN